MIVPGQSMPDPGGAGNSPMLQQSNQKAVPSQENLLMAAATMQKLGRLGGSASGAPKAPTKRKAKII